MLWDDWLQRRLKLRDLRVLVAVADTKGMSKAAKRLNCSQPAVSKAISNLERMLGQRLIERDRRGIELTPYGEALFRCSLAMFDDLRKGVAEMEFLSDPTVGAARIGCTEMVSAGIVSAVIIRLARRYPRIQFDLVQGRPASLHRALDARDIDFMITRIVDPVDEHINIEILFHERLVVAARADHRCCRRRRIGLADLANEHWILPQPESYTSLLVTEAFRTSGLAAPQIAVVSPSPFIRLTLASSGHFITVVTRSLLESNGKRFSIKALPIVLPGSRRPVGIVTLKNRALSPVANLFVEHMRASAKSLGKA